MIFAISGWKGSGKDMVAQYLIEKHGFKRLAFADVLKDMVAEQYPVDRQALDDQARKERAILSMPVTPKDEFSRRTAEYLLREFRTTQGKVCTRFAYDGQEFYGLLNVLASKPDEFWDISNPAHQGKDVHEIAVRLYWTPRALAILEGSTKRSVNPNYWVQRALSQTVPGQNYVISDARYKNEIDQLRLNAPGEVVSIRIDRFESSPSTDSSEHDLDDYVFDYRIDNQAAYFVTTDKVFEQVDQIIRMEIGLVNEG